MGQFEYCLGKEACSLNKELFFCVFNSAIFANKKLYIHVKISSHIKCEIGFTQIAMKKEMPYHMCFDTLGSKLRIDIIKALNEKEACVTDLSKKIHAERSRVSHAFFLLKRCEIIHSKKEGKKQIYFLDPRLRPLLKNNSVLVALGPYMSKYCPIYRCKK